MLQMTIGDLGAALTFIAGLIASVGAIVAFVSRRFSKAVQSQLKPLNDKVDGLTESVKQVDIDNCKNYLQQAISALDAGEKLDSAARQRFYENYDHYTNELHLNSWVHKEVERLEKENKLQR